MNLTEATIKALQGKLSEQLDFEVNNKWIPEVCGCVGGILGVIALLIKMPGFPANDILTALAIGIVSGFGATGINQVKKQFNKNE